MVVEDYVNTTWVSEYIKNFPLCLQKMKRSREKGMV